MFKYARLPMSIFVKLLLTLLLIVVPMYALSLFMNYSGTVTIKEEISKSTMQRVQFYMNLLEMEFGRLLRLQQEYINDEDLGKLAVASEAMTDIERMDAKLHLERQLVLLRDSSPYVRNASLLIPDINRTLSSNQAISTLSQRDFEALSVSSSRHESPFIVNNGRLFISVPYPDPVVLPPEGKPIFIVAVEIDRYEIQQVLKQIPGHSGSGAILIDNQSRWEIAGLSADEDMPDWIAGEDLSSDIHSMQLGGRTYMVTAETSDSLGASLITYLPENVVLGPLDKYRRGLWLLSAVSLLIIIVSSSLIYRFIHRPLLALVRAFKKAEIGNLTPIEHYRFRDEFSYLFHQYNAMVEQLKVLIHEVYEQKYRARLSELRQLQSQINPHFLYNSLFSVYRMAKSQDWDNVVRFTRYLGEYFRFITRDASHEVELETEVKFARTYTEIQGIRFAHRIQTSIEPLPESIHGYIVPRLILQPLIENAYDYGLENKKADGIIRIRFDVSEQHAVISIEDNGEELTDNRLEEMQRMIASVREPTESTGLYNVHRRIQVKFGDSSGLRLSRSELGGLLAEIVMPMKLPLHRNEG